MTTGADAAALIARLPEPYLLVSVDGRVQAANAAARGLLGLANASLEGEQLTDLLADDEEAVREYLRSCHGSGTLLPGSLRPIGAAHTLQCRGCAVVRTATDGSAKADDRLVLLRLDGDDAPTVRFAALNRTVEELTREAHERRRAERALHETQRRTAFIAEASRVLGSSIDYQTTLRNVARMAVPDFADWCAVDLLDPASGLLERVAVEHPDPARVQLAVDLHRRYPPSSDGEFGVPAVIRTGRSEHMSEIPDSLIEAAAQDEEHLRIIRELRLRSYIAAPLSTAEGTLGAITFVYAESGRTYTREDVGLLEDLARRAATAIENARLVAAIEEARERIQEQATELESQTDELQQQSGQLEEQAVELEQQLDEVESLNQTLRDINERLRVAHDQSETARTEAERANMAKSQFLAVMSHELRTPMNAILGFTDLLDAEIAGPLNPVQKAQLARVRAGARHLLGLIDQVLSLARIEAGREHVRASETDLNELIGDVVSMMEPLATRKGLALQLDLPAGLPALTTDAGKVRQILVNLIGNGIKFTESGEVRLRVRTTAEDVLLDVLDTGPGIAGLDLERIFDPFEQVDQRIARQAEGTGLGLSVSRQLARLLGGDVTASSEVGTGSTFTLRLPLAGPVAEQEATL